MPAGRQIARRSPVATQSTMDAGALLGTLPPHDVRNVRLVPYHQIQPGNNDRTTFDLDALRELAQSIEANGLAQPIVLRPIGTDRYEIVAGERRYRALGLLERAEVPAFVYDLTDQQAAAIMLAENVQRRDLSPLEEARAFRKRMDEFQWEADDVAKHASIGVAYVKRRLLLLSLSPEAQLLVDRKNLPLQHAELLACLDPNRQVVALRLFSRAKCPTFPEFRSYVGKLRAAQDQHSLFEAETERFELQLEQQERTGTRAGAGLDLARIQEEHPLPECRPRWTTGETIEAYLSELHAEGKGEAAAALAQLYDALVRGNLTSVPVTRQVPAGWLAA